MDTISNFLCVEKMGWSDAYGQLIRAISPNATTTLGYDPVGQLITETLQRHHSFAQLPHGVDNDDDSSTLSQTLTHEYDELGNRIKTTLPDGKCLNQLYYGSGHLYNQSLTDEQGNIFEIRRKHPTIPYCGDCQT